MNTLTYTTVKGNHVNTYAEAIADGGVKIRHYTPVVETFKVDAEKRAKRVAAIVARKVGE